MYTHTNGMAYSTDSEHGRLIVCMLRYGVTNYSFRFAEWPRPAGTVDWRQVRVDGRRLRSMSAIVRYVRVKYKRQG